MEDKKQKFCKKCGKELHYKGQQKRRQYCSFVCSNAHHDYHAIGKAGWNNPNRKFCNRKSGNRKPRTQDEIVRLRNIGKIGGIQSSKNQPKRSKGENLLAHLLNEYGLSIIQSQWDIVKGYEIDIFLPKKNLAISYNGEVHRKPIYGQKRLNQIIRRDIYRDRKLKEKGIQHIVVEDYGRFNKQKVILQFEWCLEQIKKLPEYSGSLNENDPS